jgi:hypothetical protein
MPSDYLVFISHGTHDSWIAAQIARVVRETGAGVFLDETDIPKGANIRQRIHEEIGRSHELIALFTPWSSKRSWVWVEIGAAWGRGIPVVAVFYGMEASNLDDSGQGKAILEDINLLQLNDFDAYALQLQRRVRGA